MDRTARYAGLSPGCARYANCAIDDANPPQAATFGASGGRSRAVLAGELPNGPIAAVNCAFDAEQLP